VARRQRSQPAATPPPIAPRRPFVGEFVLWGCCGYMVLALCGFALLRTAAATRSGNELSADRALFMAVNAATLTGFQTTIRPSDLDLAGQWALLGLMCAAALLTLLVGGAAARRILRLDFTDRHVAAAAAAFCFGGITIGSALLGASGQPILAALMQSAAALGNCGIVAGDLPGYATWESLLVLLPLVVLGGLGLPVAMQLFFLCWKHQPLTHHGRTTLAMSAGVYVAGTSLILLLQWASATPGTLVDHAALASASALNSRSAGLPFGELAALARPAQWVVLLLMVIGAGSAGTGGGLKVTAIYELFRGALRAYRGLAPTRTFAIAAAWAGTYAAIAAGVLALLLLMQPEMRDDRLLFLAISAVSNVGLSHDTVQIVGGGLNVLVAAMLLGRIAPLLVMLWMLNRVEDADVVVA